MRPGKRSRAAAVESPSASDLAHTWHVPGTEALLALVVDGTRRRVIPSGLRRCTKGAVAQLVRARDS